MKWLKRNGTGMSMVKLLIYIFFILFLIIPLSGVFLVSLTNEPINIFGSLISFETLHATMEHLNNATLANFKAVFTNTHYFAELFTSFYLINVLLISVLMMCGPIVYWIARTKMPFKKTMSAFATIPLIFPTFISAYAFIIMFGRSGWVTYIYQALGGDGLLIDPYSMTG